MYGWNRSGINPGFIYLFGLRKYSPHHNSSSSNLSHLYKVGSIHVFMLSTHHVTSTLRLSYQHPETELPAPWDWATTTLDLSSTLPKPDCPTSSDLSHQEGAKLFLRCSDQPMWHHQPPSHLNPLSSPPWRSLIFSKLFLPCLRV